MRGPAAIPTNVTRLCSALHGSATQIIFYQSGVGTATIGEMYTTVASGTGLGINDNILDAYQFLSNNYEVGDEIYLFGFSRGGFAACVLANMIIRLGLFQKRYLWMMRKAWSRYIQPDKGVAFNDFVENMWRIDTDRTQRVTIKVLGLWDAVGSVGMPDYEWVKSRGFNSSYSFYDPTLVYGIENAFHALAIDELRAPFTPMLLYLPDPESNASGFPEIKLKQCWFPGVHTNVGGGYPDSHMADLSLFWMLEQCRGMLDFEELFIAQTIQANHFPQHNFGKLKRGISRIYPGWAKGKIEDSYWTSLMPLLGKSYRKPGQSKGITNEVMHCSVRRRWQCQKLKWRPRALNGFTPVQDGDTGKWRWVKSSDGGQSVAIELPEETFQRSPTSWQHRLRNVSAKRLNFNRKLDFLAKNSHAYLRDDYEPPIKRPGHEANSASKVSDLLFSLRRWLKTRPRIL